MKKSVLKMGLVLFALNVLLFSTSSCGKDEGTSLYTIIYKWGASLIDPTDYDKMKAYVESKGCSTKSIDLMYSGTRSETDKKAKAKFDEYVSKLSQEEVAKLGLKSGAGFGYVLSRGAELGEETEVIATWAYTEK